MADVILELQDVQKYYPIVKGAFHQVVGHVKAVDGVSLTLNRGETLGLVGESGCGKSVSCMSILQLNPPQRTLYPTGEILFDGKDLLKMNQKQLRPIRGNEIAMVFQEPMTAMNPLFTIGDQLMEALRVHDHKISKADAYDQSIEAVRRVKIPNPERILNSYPFALSGGMRQRVMIAMALACKPKLLIADEPTTALDVTIQAQILKLMNDLKREHGTSILFITHDLGVIAQMADDVAVMYCGQVVEMAPAKTLFTDCEFSHPYTEGLMVSIPRLDTPAGVRLESIPGSVPHPLNLPKGCKFAPRCKYCQQRCLEEEPELVNVTEEQQVRCFYPRKEERRANLK